MQQSLLVRSVYMHLHPKTESKFLQVIQCLRAHTSEMDFLCVKTVDGRGAEVDYSALPDVSFSMQQQPTLNSWTKEGFPVPAWGSLVKENSGYASESMAGDLSALLQRD